MSDNCTPTIDPSKIKGNASDTVRNLLSNTAAYFSGVAQDSRFKPVFAQDINKRFVVTEARIESKREDETKKEAVVVVELDVTEDMANAGGVMHGGCTAYLIDQTTTLALLMYSLDVENKFFSGVSQSLNVVYHSPAAVGDKLRIVNYTVAGGSRAKTARCEIWNATHHRLVASAVHIKMQPSKPLLRTKL